MSKQSVVKAFAPATVANVACGFDIFGFALEQPGDEVEVRFSDRLGVTIAAITGDQQKLPLDASKNTAGVAVLQLLQYLQAEKGIEIALHKKMPLGSGLGSSAASAVAALVAVNELLGQPCTRDELLPFAMEAERVACGTAHADNVAPALLGGFILVRSYDPLDVIQVPCAVSFFAAVLYPHMEIRTEEARKLLKPEISLRQHVVQSGNAAGLMVGLMAGDLSLIQGSLQDVIVEPVRAQLIPGFSAIKQAALSAGALGCSISGAGPSIFALALTSSTASAIGEAMQAVCQAQGMECTLYVSALNHEGARVLTGNL